MSLTSLRSNALRCLARQFLSAASDSEAHHFWNSVFGLSPARHLFINDETLDAYDAADAGPNTSWMDAPALRISYRPFKAGLSRIIDRTTEKQRLAEATRDETQRMLDAQMRFGNGQRMRLSQLERLDPDEFGLLLEVLADAGSSNAFTIKLTPTDDDTTAHITSPQGTFSGPDHWLSIEVDK